MCSMCERGGPCEVNRVVIGSKDAAAVGGLLRDIAVESGFSPKLRQSAVYWSDAMDSSMDRRDLDRIARVLLRASGDRAMPRAQRRAARFWAGYLQART
jgi:hypothetical protein